MRLPCSLKPLSSKRFCFSGKILSLVCVYPGNSQLVLNLLRDMISYACDRGLYISVGGEDSSHADDKFLLNMALAAQDWGASRFRFCDT